MIPHLSSKLHFPGCKMCCFRDATTFQFCHMIIPKEVELHISVDHCPITFGIPLPSVDHYILLIHPPFLNAYLTLSEHPKLIIKIGKKLNRFTIGLTSIGSTKICLKVSKCSGQVSLDFLWRSLEAIPCHPYLKPTRNITKSVLPTLPRIVWQFLTLSSCSHLRIRGTAITPSGH